jgi:hypothetical protein
MTYNRPPDKCFSVFALLQIPYCQAAGRAIYFNMISIPLLFLVVIARVRFSSCTLCKDYASLFIERVILIDMGSHVLPDAAPSLPSFGHALLAAG